MPTWPRAARERWGPDLPRLASPFIPARGTRAPALRPRSFRRAGLGRPPCVPVHSGARDSGARLASPFIRARGTRAPALRPRSFGRAGVPPPPCAPALCTEGRAYRTAPPSEPPVRVRSYGRTVHVTAERRTEPRSGGEPRAPVPERKAERHLGHARKRRGACKCKGGGMPRLQRAPKVAGTDQGEGTRPASRRPT